MKHFPLPFVWVACLLAVPLHAVAAEAPPKVSFQVDPGKVVITAGGAPLAAYVHRDEKITRPYFAHVHAPGKVRVTRNHPPVAKKDATDHADLHPGIWLAFGDLSGADSWRNKARVKHEKFIEAPKGDSGKGSFAVSNLYLSADGKKVVCRETCRYTVLVRPAGYLLVWDSSFRSENEDFAFGDQEEMGLGVRVATPLTVKGGGQILTSDGDRNEKQVRGKKSTWCDYAGAIDGRRAGVTLMPHPKNFRPCWYHARDYGFVAANPFGRKALTGGEPSRVVVKKGETFRLRFGVLLHASPADRPADLAAAYKDYLKHSADE
jgi:hypothetical protein